VTIVLKDVNDMAPEFVSPNETSVPENLPVNTVVMAVKAVDKDEGRNSYVEYSLSGEGTSSVFTLGPVDGLLRVSGRLDRENRANYTLQVRDGYFFSKLISCYVGHSEVIIDITFSKLCIDVRVRSVIGLFLDQSKLACWLLLNFGNLFLEMLKLCMEGPNRLFYQKQCTFI
jgi:hypothetical protein